MRAVDRLRSFGRALAVVQLHVQIEAVEVRDDVIRPARHVRFDHILHRALVCGQLIRNIAQRRLEIAEQTLPEVTQKRDLGA